MKDQDKLNNPVYGREPTPKEIANLKRCIEWTSWLTADEQKLVWLRAKKIDWRTIGREVGCNRFVALYKWKRALKKIATRLNESGAPLD